MGRLSFSVIDVDEDKVIYGLSKKTNDKVQSKDIPSVSKKYYELANRKSGGVIPFFIVSKDYDESTKDFELFIGGLLENEALETLIIPKGLYGKVTIKPKMGFLWGLSIGQAKRAFYMDWLPTSGYIALNMEYEWHTENSTGKNAQIDILFSIKKHSN